MSLYIFIFRYIRLWDAHKEMKNTDLPTGSDSYVSSLTFSSYYAASSTSGIFTAGKLFEVLRYVFDCWVRSMGPLW